jgi:hydroxymethylbilane synthase
MRIGTRGSALALAQAGWVAERLGAPVEIVTVLTSGDRADAAGRDPSPWTDKSRWVSELELALLAGEIDVAVHSAKDVPAELADGLELVAIPERADPRDAICGAASLAALPNGARVGTSSLRRHAQLRSLRDDLEIVSVRGNVDTRLRKLETGELDALILALAGLQRLRRADEAGSALDELVPAAGQGALALEARAGDGGLAERLTALTDPEASTCVTAERELVHALGASCNTPVGAHASVDDQGRLSLEAWVGLPDGSAWLADRVLAERGQTDHVGAVVAERMLAAGAGDLLRAAEAAA